ncbi:GIP [Symbiodinium sp. CCMP2456]|nr:GIP [Symbiodinium sp. CCMP2456]
MAQSMHLPPRPGSAGISDAIHATQSLPVGLYSKLGQAEGPRVPDVGGHQMALQALPSEPGTIRMHPQELLPHLDKLQPTHPLQSDPPQSGHREPNDMQPAQVPPVHSTHTSNQHAPHTAASCAAKAGHPHAPTQNFSQHAAPVQFHGHAATQSSHLHHTPVAKHGRPSPAQPPIPPQLPVAARGHGAGHAMAKASSSVLDGGASPASPKAPQKPKTAPHPQLSQRDHDLLQQLHARHQAKAQAKAGRAKSPHRGDRGSLSPKVHSPHASSPSVAEAENQHAATAAAVAAAVDVQDGPQSQWPELEPDALQNEVAAREVELRVLRQELSARSQEVLRLEEEIHEAEDQLRQATGHVGTLSAKVEAASGSTQAVLQASARHLDTQVTTLKKRLASAEVELAEKDEELSGLQEAVAHGSQQVTAKAAELQTLMDQHKLQGSKVAKLQKDSDLLHRHMAIDQWRHQVEALVEQEQEDAVKIRERREHQRQIEVFQEEIVALKSYIARMEEKCQFHAGEVHRRKEVLKALVMEERLCVAAARLGHETADELKRGQMEEQRVLEARLHEEMGRRTSLPAQAKTYEQMEAHARHDQEQLAALTVCVREAARAMKDHGPHISKTAVDDAVDSFLQKMRHQGELAPPILRMSASAHLVADQAVTLELTHAGQLCVRGKSGLVPMADFLRQHGFMKKHHEGQPLPKPAAHSAADAAHVHPSHASQPLHPSHPSHLAHTAHPSTHPVHPVHPAHPLPAQTTHPAHAGYPARHAHPPHLAHPAHAAHPGHPAHLANAHQAPPAHSHISSSGHGAQQLHLAAHNHPQVPKSTLGDAKTPLHAAAEAHLTPHKMVHHQEGVTMAV